MRDPGCLLKSLSFQKELQTFAVRYLLQPIEQPDLTATLHHISFGVADIERAARFYDTALAPLGYVRVWDDIRPGEADQVVGYGAPGAGTSWRSSSAGKDEGRISTLPLRHRTDGPSTKFHQAAAAGKMAHPACGSTTGPTTTPPSSSPE